MENFPDPVRFFDGNPFVIAFDIVSSAVVFMVSVAFLVLVTVGGLLLLGKIIRSINIQNEKIRLTVWLMVLVFYSLAVSLPAWIFVIQQWQF